MAKSINVNDAQQLEKEADVAGAKLDKAADAAQSALDRLNRLSDRGKKLKKELSAEPD